MEELKNELQKLIASLSGTESMQDLMERFFDILRTHADALSVLEGRYRLKTSDTGLSFAFEAGKDGLKVLNADDKTDATLTATESDLMALIRRELIPMAEFVMKDMLKKRRLNHVAEVASAATSTYEIGNPVHRGTRAKLNEHGISCAGKTARLLTRADYQEYDYIIGMDESNMRDMRQLFGSDPSALGGCQM